MKSILKTFSAIFIAAAIFAFASCQQDTGPGTVATYVCDMSSPTEYTMKVTAVFYEDNTFVVSESFSGEDTNSNSAKITINSNFDVYAGTWEGDFSKGGDIKYTITKKVDETALSSFGLTEEQVTTMTSATEDTTITVTSADVPLTAVAEADQVEATATLSDDTKTLTLFNGSLTLTKQ